MTAIDCVVLDMDDTLFLERDYVRSGLRRVDAVLEQRHRVTGFFDVAWTEFLNGRRGDIFNAALVALGCRTSAEMLAGLVDCYRTHDPEIALLPDADAFLAARRCAAVITDGPLDSQRRKAERLGLSSRVRQVVLTAAYGPAFHKPSPAAFEMVQRIHGAAPERCCYIGDNPAKDFQGPKSLGWRTVRIRRPQGLHCDVPSDAHVDEEIEDFGGLETAFDAS